MLAKLASSTERLEKKKKLITAIETKALSLSST
jgi:hypothetical protein